MGDKKAKENNAAGNPRDRLLVCGLGSLGQYCVRELAAFGVLVSAIELMANPDWEIDGLEDMLEELHEGDCRQYSLLERIDLSRFRAVLLVTNRDRVNIDAALTIRLLSPSIRIVMRSSKEGLNKLLSEQLGDCIAFEPTKLSAPAFVSAAMGDALIAHFQLRDWFVKVERHTSATHPELTRKSLACFESGLSTVLFVETAGSEFQEFFHWDYENTVGENDAVITLEVSRRPDIAAAKVASNGTEWDGLAGNDQKRTQIEKKGTKRVFAQFKKGLANLSNWVLQDQVRRVALIYSATIIVLLCISALCFRLWAGGISTVDAIYDSVVLLLGGYPDLLGSELRFSLEIPWWLRLMGLMLTMGGTVLMGLIYAVITQHLLSARFQFGKRQSLPTENHVIVFGLQRVGEEVVRQLKSFKMTMVGISSNDSEDREIAIVSRDAAGLEKCLNLANLEKAASLLSLSRDELANLELCLLARQIRPDIRLVIRTWDARFSDHLARLWPQARVLSTSGLAAKAFVSAAFGENVPALFCFGSKTILVTEYRVQKGDTLENMVLVKFACGYGVVPLMVVKANEEKTFALPPEDIVLEQGDTLYVLAPIEGIRRIETGNLLSAQYILHVEKPLREDALFNGANILSRMTGVSIGQCREFMTGLPAPFPEKMHLHQGKLLVSLLKRNMLAAELRADDPD